MNSSQLTPADLASDEIKQKAARSAYESQSRLSAEEKEALILQELPRVRYIAKRIHDRLPRSVSLDDLIHNGVLGLMEAVNNFDPGKHIDLGVYAKHRIRGAILDSLREMDWGPRLLRKKGRDLDKAREQLQARLGRKAEENELAQAAALSIDELRLLEEKLLRLDLSTVHEQEVDEENGNSLDNLPAKNIPDPFTLCLRGEVKEILREAIGELPDRERQVLALYYYEELTMKEEGVVLGVGEARVSQLHASAVSRLRSHLEKTTGNANGKKVATEKRRT